MTLRPNYSALRQLAYEKRTAYNVTTETLNLNVLRAIYKAEGIRIDPWKFPSTIRAVYMCEDSDPSVAVNKTLPREPRLFSLIHELKHHYLDQQLLQNGEIRCGDYNQNQVIEIGAEVFAAEFIYPEVEFVECVEGLGIQIGQCSAEDVVRLKRDCNACVSYAFLRKRLTRLKYAAVGSLDGIQFQKLEDQMYGQPIYKQAWFKQRRKSRSGSML